MKPPIPQMCFWSLGEVLREANCSEAELRSACDRLRIESADTLINGVEMFNGLSAPLIMQEVLRMRSELARQSAEKTAAVEPQHPAQPGKLVN